MLNKNDPLIGAVQEVMKKNQAEREAAKIVNEAFGVEDRKALPHELQGEWDAAYKTVLTEGVEALDEAKLSPEHKSVITQKLQKIHGKGKVKFGPNGATWSDGIDQRTHDVSVNRRTGKVKMDSSPYLESQLEEEALDEKLVGNQSKIDVASSTGEKKPDGKLTKHDFEHLRSMKEATFPGAPSVKMPMKTSKHEKMYNDRHRELKSLSDSGKINTPEGKKQASELIDRIQGLVDKHLPGSPVPSKKIWLGEEGDPSKAIRGDVVTGGSSVTTVKSTPKPTSVTPADQSALKKKIQSVVKEAKVNPYAVGMAAVKKSTGDEPPMEKKNIIKAHKIAKKIIAKKKMNEGFNNRHGLSVTASAEKQTVADQLNEKVGLPLAARQAQERLAKNKAMTASRLAREPKEAPSSIGSRVNQGLGAADAFVRRVGSGMGGDYVATLGNYAVNKLSGKDTSLSKEYEKQQELNKRAELNYPTATKWGDVADIASTAAGVGGLVKGGLKAGAKYLARKKADDVVQSITKTVPQSAAASGTFLSGAKNLSKSSKQAQLARVGGSTVTANQSAIRTRLAQKAKDLRSGVATGAGKTVAAVKKYPGIPAGAAGGAAIIGAAALNNRPSKSVAAATSAGPSFEKTGRGTAPSLSSNAEKIKTSTQTTTTQPDYDKMTFSQAFKTARQQAGGASGKFKYKGKEYQTNIQGTGTAKKPQEKYQAASKLKTIAPAPVTKTTTSVMGGQGIAAIPGGASKMKSTVSLAAKPSAMAAKSDTYQKGPDTSFNARHNYGDSKLSTSQRDVRSTSNPEKIANPTFVPQRITNRQSNELGQEITSTLASTRRVGPDGQGGLTVGQNKPMGMSFTPKTTVDTVKKPAASVTPQMSQSVSSLQQKSSMAGKERGLAPDFAKRELTRRQNIQTVKGA